MSIPSLISFATSGAARPAAARWAAGSPGLAPRSAGARACRGQGAPRPELAADAWNRRAEESPARMLARGADPTPPGPPRDPAGPCWVRPGLAICMERMEPPDWRRSDVAFVRGTQIRSLGSDPGAAFVRRPPMQVLRSAPGWFARRVRARDADPRPPAHIRPSYAPRKTALVVCCGIAGAGA